MLSISIRYGGKLSYAMRALSPMLGSNSCQAETALSQVLGHDGASRHTLLSKMLRHNSTRAQNHSDISIGLRQRSCTAVCDMFLWKNHGSHFTTIKSIGKTHYPVPLRFAVNGSASPRSASPPPTLATAGRRGSNVRQGPAAPGQQRRHARICTRSCSTRSVAIRINGDIRRLKLSGTASPRAPRHRSGRLARKGHGNDHLSFACAAEGS